MAKHRKLPMSTDSGCRESVKHHKQHPCSGVSTVQVHAPSAAVRKHGIPIASPFLFNHRTSLVPRTRIRLQAHRTGVKLRQQTPGTDSSPRGRILEATDMELWRFCLPVCREQGLTTKRKHTSRTQGFQRSLYISWEKLSRCNDRQVNHLEHRFCAGAN